MLLFIPSILKGDMSTFFMKLSVVLLLWLIAFAASLVDLKTGIAASKRLGKFKTTSSGLRQTLKKDGQYFMLLLIAFLFDFVFSYFTELAHIWAILGIFKLPLFTLIAVAIVLTIEGISVRENLDKGSDKEIVPQEVVNHALDIIGELGEDKIKAIVELLKEKKGVTNG